MNDFQEFLEIKLINLVIFLSDKFWSNTVLQCGGARGVGGGGVEGFR